MPAIASGDEPSSESQLSTSVPELSLAEAAELAERHYGIRGTAELLTSERDRNFRLSADDGGAYLFKVSNPSEEADVIDLQTACLDHIAERDPARPVPRVLPTLSGAKRDQTVLTDGRRCMIRLLSFLEGVPAKGTRRSGAQRMAMGKALAELDLALRGFAHPAAAHDLLWNVARADRLAHLLDEIADERRRQLAGHFMRRYVAETLPRLADVRAQVIHNDFHFYNILVDAENSDQVTGIIDFGDLVHAPLVGEVATAAAYHMTEADEPLAAAAEFIGAYHAVLPLLPEEQEIVVELVAARHLITVLISEWRSQRYPENYAYIMRHNPASWDALHLMADLSPQCARDGMLACVRSGDDR
jgi:Ser/Thr protein kinase RdoA (MazF antagonist)